MGSENEVRFLLDTNVGIQLEEVEKKSGQIRQSFRTFSELCHRYGIKLFHHPDSQIDISNDKDETRQRATKSRFRKYPALTNFPHGEVSELEELFKPIDSSNDLVDCQILYSIKRDCIEYLVSEDIGLHKRASYAGLNERVFTVDEAINFLQRNFSSEHSNFPNTEKVNLKKIDFNEPFFDSLKADYGSFLTWFKGMQDKGEEAWVIRENDKIAAICIIEDKGYGKLSYRPDHKTLKVCTFKVGLEHTGQKYGELLLKSLFSYCIHENYDLVYLTTFPKQAPLIYVLRDFGFSLGPKPRNNGELELFKTFTPPPVTHPRVDPLKFHIAWSPYYYDDRKIEKYIIPIQPQYHDILFPEIRSITPLFEDSNKIPPGNTIKKVYLCHSPTKSIETGSLILFYRSSSEKNLTTLAIVEETFRSDDYFKVMKEIGKRSVYSSAEIRDIVKKETMVIKFRLIKHLPKQFTLSELISLKVLKSAPFSITSISHDAYLSLKINPGN